MKFTPKMSGTQVTDFQIEPISESQVVELVEMAQKITRQKAMDFLLDEFRFSLGQDGKYRAVLDFDSIYKLSILESYPDYEAEMVAYFGENWLNHYIRFGH